MSFPIVTEMQVTRLENGGLPGITVGLRLFATFTGDSQEKADSIRKFTLIGAGLCQKKSKEIAIYYNPENKKMLGISATNPIRTFAVTFRAIGDD